MDGDTSTTPAPPTHTHARKSDALYVCAVCCVRLEWAVMAVMEIANEITTTSFACECLHSFLIHAAMPPNGWVGCNLLTDGFCQITVKNSDLILSEY